MKPHVIKAPEPFLVFSSGDTIRLACVFGGQWDSWYGPSGRDPGLMYDLDAGNSYFFAEFILILTSISKDYL